MAVSLPSDLILDVTRAAPSEQVEAARQRLASAATGQASGDFDKSIGFARAAPGRAADQTPAQESFVKFEAMMLQSFLQSMMPKEQSAVYGEGLSGEMWQSMLAEQIANVMAERGGIGVADRILKEYYKDGDQIAAVQGVATDAQAADRAERGLTAEAILQQSRRLVDGSLTGISQVGRNDID